MNLSNGAISPKPLLLILLVVALVTGSSKQARSADAPMPGMVWIAGGKFDMGAVVNGQGSGEMQMPSNDAEPVHSVRVDGFWIDKTEVTNEQFAKFVAATGYVTIA